MTPDSYNEDTNKRFSRLGNLLWMTNAILLVSGIGGYIAFRSPFSESFAIASAIIGLVGLVVVEVLGET